MSVTSVGMPTDEGWKKLAKLLVELIENSDEIIGLIASEVNKNYKEKPLEEIVNNLKSLKLDKLFNLIEIGKPYHDIIKVIAARKVVKSYLLLAKEKGKNYSTYERQFKELNNYITKVALGEKVDDFCYDKTLAALGGVVKILTYSNLDL